MTLQNSLSWRKWPHFLVLSSKQYVTGRLSRAAIFISDALEQIFERKLCFHEAIEHNWKSKMSVLKKLNLWLWKSQYIKVVEWYQNHHFKIINLSWVRPKPGHQLSQQSNSSNLERNRAKAYFHIPHIHISYFVRLNSKLLSDFHHSSEAYTGLTDMNLAHLNNTLPFGYWQ